MAFLLLSLLRPSFELQTRLFHQLIKLVAVVTQGVLEGLSYLIGHLFGISGDKHPSLSFNYEPTQQRPLLVHSMLHVSGYNEMMKYVRKSLCGLRN